MQTAILFFSALAIGATPATESDFTVRISFEGAVSADPRPGMRVDGAYMPARMFGLFFRSAILDTSANGLLGLRLRPASDLIIDAGAGIGQALWPYWFGGHMRYGEPNAFASWRFEAGGSGIWYQGMLRAEFWHMLGLGVVLKYREGLGPFADFTLPWIPVTLALDAYAYDPDRPGFHPHFGWYLKIDFGR